jgi:hypothetical protein
MVKINYKQIYFFLSQIPEAGGMSTREKMEGWVYQFSGGRTADIKAMDELEYRTMVLEMQNTVRRTNPEMVKLETFRRRVLGAFCEYYSLMGYYKDLSDSERIEKAKGEAVKAKGQEIKANGKPMSFNDIPLSELQALYGGKLRQNKILRNVNKKFEQDLKEDLR